MRLKYKQQGEFGMNRKSGLITVLLLIFSGSIAAGESSNMKTDIDQRSFRLGGISSFAEMVRVDVKTLALSAAMAPEDMDALVDAANHIASEEKVRLYRESDLIVTDLFPADVAVGKDVLLIYKGTTLDDYMALKKHKAKLVEAGKYEGEARRKVAIKFGRLLSYPDSVIEDKLK
jgi:hypothetical protein